MPLLSVGNVPRAGALLIAALGHVQCALLRFVARSHCASDQKLGAELRAVNAVHLLQRPEKAAVLL